jgi:transcriptional regulator with XRE-family HTH domain
MSPYGAGKRMVQTLRKSGVTRRSKRSEQRKLAAQKILTALIESGMRQNDIAEYLGMTQSGVSNNLNGITTASMSTLICLVRLAKAHRIDIPEMLIWREL